MRALVLICSLAASAALANAGGVVGYSGKPPAADCNGCHTGGNAPTVSITGPNTLAAGATGTYTFTVSAGSYSVNIAAEPAAAALNPISATLTSAFGELTQRQRSHFLHQPDRRGPHLSQHPLEIGVLGPMQVGG